MKILIIQLARFGDIYISWPAIRALKRAFPNSEIHLLTRKTFSDAVNGLEEISRHWELDSKLFLWPLMGLQQEDTQRGFLNENQNNDRVQESICLVDEFCNQIKSEEFDWIINLSFSPLSSYLCHAFSAPHTKVSGYSRHVDGYLNIPDQISGYFYSQVGLGKSNRIHLADIFIALIGLEYKPEDWRPPRLASLSFRLPKEFITIHIGASSQDKRIPSVFWIKIIEKFISTHSDIKVVLIGSQSERFIADEIISHVDRSQIVDLVSKTKIYELFTILSQSKLLIGCDSSPIHMAALTDTPVYNLSFGQVNFWETGPKSSNAYIERLESLEFINTEKIGDTIYSLLQNNPSSRLIQRSDHLESYIAPQTPQEAFSWSLIKAIYFGEPFPVCDDIEFYNAIKRIFEISTIVLQSLNDFSDEKKESLHRLLDVSDDIIKKIGEIVPHIRPLCGWIESQKIMIKPGSRSFVLKETISIYTTLLKMLRVYLLQEDQDQVVNMS